MSYETEIIAELKAHDLNGLYSTLLTVPTTLLCTVHAAAVNYGLKLIVVHIGSR